MGIRLGLPLFSTSVYRHLYIDKCVSGGSSASTSQSSVDHLPSYLDAVPTRYRISDVSCGLGHCLFLTDAGRVLAWGNGGSGRLGLGSTADCIEATLVTGESPAVAFSYRQFILLI